MSQTDFTTYSKIRAVNWGTLAAMQRSPAHYRYRLLTPREDSDAMRLGRVIHTAVLEPEMLETRYAVWEGGRRGTNAHKEWLAEQGEREPITAADLEKGQGVALAVSKHERARMVLRGGRVESTLRWVDPVTHIRCKARPDHIRGGNLTDLKSSKDIDAHQFGRTVANLGYHGQLAFYARGLIATSRVEDPVVRIVAVEAEPPHDVAVYRLDDDTLYAGDLLVGRLLAEVALWRKRGRWPGRYEEETLLQFPAWALPAYLLLGEIEVLP